MSTAWQDAIHPTFSKGKNICCHCSSYCMPPAISRF